MGKPTFTRHPVGGDRRFYVLEEDVRRAFGRLPRPLRQAVRRLRLDDEGWATYRLGHAAPGGREVALCALPPRLSLARFLPAGLTPAAFGAVRGSQWPAVAVRRYQLYHTFLAECLRAAEGERGLDARANALRRELWGADPAPDDPAHGPPSEEERERVAATWEPSQKAFKLGLARRREGDEAGAVELFRTSVEHEPTHAGACLALALAALESGDPAAARAHLRRALRADPALPGAHLALARAALLLGADDEAEAAFAEAARVEPRPSIAWALHGATRAARGDAGGAEELFRRALRKDPEHGPVLRTIADALERRGGDDARERARELRARAR